MKDSITHHIPTNRSNTTKTRLAIISGALVLTFLTMNEKAEAQSNGSKTQDNSQKISSIDHLNGKINIDTYQIGGIGEQKTLDTKVLTNIEERKFFDERLRACTFISVKFTDRSTIQNMKGNFLVPIEKGDTNRKDNIEYTLYLPYDMSIGELPSIIKRINTITFGDSLPDRASYKEIQRNIESIIVYYLSLKTENNKKDIQKAINKYYVLYQTYFPGENPRLDSTRTDNKNLGEEYFKEEMQQINNDFNNYGIQFLTSKIDQSIAKNIYTHFFEAFFENGTEILGNIDNIKQDTQISDMKKQLDKVKLSKNMKIIVQKEKEILNKILLRIYNNGFSYKDNSEFLYNTSVPADIIRTKNITCVGFSILSHSLLSDLGIPYTITLSEGHSAISVTLTNGKNYIFDALQYDHIIPYNIVGNRGGRTDITYKNNEQLIQDKIIAGDDADKTLISQILANKEQTLKGEDKKTLQERLGILERSLSVYNRNPFTRYNIAYINERLGNTQKGIIAINNAIKITPDLAIYRYMRYSLYSNTDDIQERQRSKDIYENLEKQYK